jgi:hypothetical protein
MMWNKEGGPTSFILPVARLDRACASASWGTFGIGAEIQAKQKELGSVTVSRQFIPRRGHSLMVKYQPSKLAMRVRFPLPAFLHFGFRMEISY